MVDLISVIIPMFNAEKYVAQTIDSVAAQTYHPTEIIVIDDGSDDGSAGIVKNYESVRYYFQPNRGAGAAVNKGIEMATGNYFAFLDADDLWTPEKLTQEMVAFKNDFSLDIVFCHIEQFLSSDVVQNNQETPLSILGKQPGYSRCTMLVKRHSFLRVGLFDDNLRIGDFIDWYARAVEGGLKIHMISDVMMKRRIHKDNMGIREFDARTDYARILKAMLDRRRKTQKEGDSSPIV